MIQSLSDQTMPWTMIRNTNNYINMSATKMKNLTRIFKSYKNMTANDIESDYQKDN